MGSQSGHGNQTMTLVEMLRQAKGATPQKELAAALGITPQYLCDLEKGRRHGSVEFVNRVCDWLGCDDSDRKRWHRAGARAHGWEI